MDREKLGRLRKVDLRDGWSSEAAHFTPWLAKEENLRLLSEAIGIELELEAQEQFVGPFRADILCKDTVTDGWVLIENQLERTDHTHLGQLLTYAAGLNAVTIVWIAQRFTDEHRAALDWLNERTDENINLFGLEIELWQIGDSAIAPKFNVICQPNDWSRRVQQAAHDSAELSEHRQLQHRFWSAFQQFMETNRSFVRCTKPAPRPWMNHPIGRSGVHLSSVVSTRHPDLEDGSQELRVQLYLDGPNAKLEFAELEKRKDELERAVGFPLVWHSSEGRAACRVYTRQSADALDEALWPQHFRWFQQRLERMHTVFGPIMQQLKREAAR